MHDAAKYSLSLLRVQVICCALAAVLLAPAQPVWAQQGDAVLVALYEYVQNHPGDIDKRLAYAERLEQNGLLPEAAEQFEHVLGVRSSDVGLLKRLARLYSWSGRTERQIAAYERILALEPDDLAVRRLLSEHYFYTEHVEKGIRQLELIVEQRPGNLEVRRTLANHYFWSAQPERGLRQLELILKQRPDNAELRQELAQRYFWNGQQDEGVQQLDLVLKQQPENLEIRRTLANHYFWTGRPQKGIEQLSFILERQPDDVVLRRELAQHYFWTNRPQEGIRHLELVLERRPDDLSLRDSLATHYAAHATYEKAADQYRIILEQAPEDREAARKLGQVLMASGRPASAAEAYRQVVEATPYDVAARLSLAKALAWSSQPDEALSQLQVVLQQAPDNTEALLLAGGLQRWEPVSWHKAKEKLQRLLALEPNNQEARSLLQGIRRNYGPALQAGFRRVTDSNGRTREEVPLGLAAWASGAWQFSARVGYSRLIDDQVSDELSLSGSDAHSYDFSGAVARRFQSGTSVHAQLGVSTFNSGWTPLAGQLRVEQSILGTTTVALSLAQDEVLGSLDALREHVRVRQLSGTWYTRPVERLELWGQGGYLRYTDHNSGVAGSASVRLYAFLEKPTLALSSTYSYRDTRRIYLNSRPYWTPDNLSTFSVALELEHVLSSWLELGGRYGVSRQQEVSQDFALELNVTPGAFHTIRAAFERMGSNVYSYEAFTLQYTYRL